ncbi:cobalamin-dependent protein [soil metagenome]
MSYRIKSASALTGISSATLRAWERRYGVVTPERSASGYRAYSDADLERLRRVKTLVEQGYKVSEAVELARGPGRAEPLGDPPPAEMIRGELQRALLALDRRAAASTVPALARHPFEVQMLEILFPILREIGERWARGEADIVQEHFAAAFARARLVAMLETLRSDAASGREAVFAGLPGEEHELGLLGAAVLLAQRGWQITYLGLDVPFVDLEALLQSRQPALFCTSLLRRVSPDECLSLAQRLREIAPCDTDVLIGGAGVPAELDGRRHSGWMCSRGFPKDLSPEQASGAG